jgi:hypothetical protein
MGAATPAVAAVNPWLAGATLGLGLVNTFVGASNASSAASAQATAMQQQAEHQRQLMQRQFEMEERRRTNLLERSQARARVSFGARGISTTDGSAGALLDGIQSRANEEAADARSMLDYQVGGVNAGLAASLQRLDANRPDLLSSAQRVTGQVSQLLNWGQRQFGDTPRGDVERAPQAPRAPRTPIYGGYGGGFDPRDPTWT